MITKNHAKSKDFWKSGIFKKVKNGEALLNKLYDDEFGNTKDFGATNVKASKKTISARSKH